MAIVTVVMKAPITKPPLVGIKYIGNQTKQVAPATIANIVIAYTKNIKTFLIFS